MYFLQIFVHWLVSWMINDQPFELNLTLDLTWLDIIQVQFSYFIYKIWNKNGFDSSDRKLTQYSQVFWPHHFNLYYFLYFLCSPFAMSNPIYIYVYSQCVDKICLMSDFNSKRFNVFIVACAIQFKNWLSFCKSLTYLQNIKSKMR